MSLENPQNRLDASQNFNCIDLIKFLCSFLIVAIHIPSIPHDSFPLAKYIDFGLRHAFSRIAVPFYFACSGFFLFRKMSRSDIQKETIQNYCFKNLRLLGLWWLLLSTTNTFHLWYLGAVVVAVTLLSVCFHIRMRFRYICLLAGVLYLIGLLGDTYYGLVTPLTNIGIFKLVIRGYDYIFASTRNGVFMGFIFVLMGAYFAFAKVTIKPWVSFLCFVLSLVCMLVEAFLLRYFDLPQEYNMYIFALPAAFFLFSFAKTVQLQNRPIYRRLRTVGFLVYMTHLLYSEVIRLVLGALGIALNGNLMFCRLPVALLMTLVLSFGIEWLSHKKKFRWLRYFIS